MIEPEILSYARGMLMGVTASVSSEVLIGREADLAALRDALKRTRSAEPSTVLVGGEAGVGKTRLVEEFVRGAAADVAHVLTGHSLELGEEGLPFAPFAGALRELVNRCGAETLGDRAQEFARLLPELGPPEAGGDTRRGRLFDSVAALFARLTVDRPLILVLEDLHWADRSTRDLIGFLVRSARLPYLLLIGTYRTDELHRGHPLRPFLAELDRVRGVQRRELDRLDRDGTAELLTHLLGVEPEPRTVDTVNERAQGIPFFIEQFAASGNECGDIPDNLRDLLLSRVDLLPEPAQRVLRVAAVGGTRFGHELISRVAGMSEPDLESALRAVVAAQLIVVEAGGEYEFRHALVREAVHDDLLPGEHARLHARYAEVIEAEPGLVPMGRAPAEIAHHWHAAHDHPKALVSARRAADDAGRRHAYGEQARLLDRVLEVWELVPGAGAMLGTGHLDLLEEAAMVAIEAGEIMRALSLTREALADLDAEAEPLRAARLLVRRAKLLQNAGKSDGTEQARTAYDLLRRLPHTAETVALLADVAYALSVVDRELGGRIAQEAVTAASGVDDAPAQVGATITYGQVCAGRLTPDEGLPLMTEAAETARAAGDLPNLARALVNISDGLFGTGRYAESADAAREGVPHADRVGVSRTTGVFLLANYAEAQLALGHWDDADAHLAEAFRLDPPGTLALPALRLRVRLRLARGHDGADHLVNRALTFLGKPYLHRENRLNLHELRVLAALYGDDDAALRLATRAAIAEGQAGVREAAAGGHPDSPRYAWPLIAAAAEAADRLDDAGVGQGLSGGPQDAGAGQGPSGAAQDAGAGQGSFGAARDAGLRDQVAELAAATAVDRAFDRAYRAQVAATLSTGDPVAELAQWHIAVTEWRADGMRFPLASALLGLAAAAAAAGERGVAAGAIEEARAIADELGAVPVIERANRLANRLGLRSAAPAAATGGTGSGAGRGTGSGTGRGTGRGTDSGTGTEVLTAREREVLRLVSEGRTNGQIAEHLYISPKTASVHVSRIIAKLDVANRGEAAAVARRLGLLRDPA